MKYFSVGLLSALISLVSFAGDVTSLLTKPAPSPSKDVSMPAPGGAQIFESSISGQGIEAEVKPVIAGFEVYGSTKINAASVRRYFGTEIDQWFKLGLSADPSVTALEKKLLKAITDKYDLAFAEWSIVQHLEPPNIAIYVTLDVVEKTDATRRMDFLALPTKQLSDPGGLLALWDEYQKVALGLVEMGELELDTTDCEALHCPFGHKHPKLQKYEKLFVEGAKSHAAKLAEVLVNDSRPENRGAAAFILAYQKDGKAVIDQLLPSIRDNDDLVRNNVLRVLGDIAEFRPELLVPTQSVAAALEFPRVSDRSKAINAVYFLAMNSAQARQYLMEHSVPTLLRMLQSDQPDHRMAAHAVLRKLSGKNHAATDVRAWLAWSQKAPGAGRAVSKAR